MKINRQGKSRTLDTEQLDLITSYLPSNKHKLISLLLRKSAARISEIVSLRYQDLTPTTILIPKQVVKGKLRPREIPISKYTFEQILKFKAYCIENGEDTSPDSFIFKGRNNKTSLTTRAFQKVLSKAVERASLIGFSSHGYRRSS